MHFEFLVEDQSGKKALEILVPKMLGNDITYRVISYKGIGRISRGLKPKTEANKRILLDQLPKLLQGYGKSPHFRDSGQIVVVCDLDDKDKNSFSEELNSVLNACNPKPRASFCLAIEEFEAWYLGDLDAIRKAYPNADNKVLNRYKNDSICGTWELLADAVYKGGRKALSDKGWQAEGEQKSVWAEKISPHMDVDINKSPSFVEMYEKLKDIAK
jgi:hypothetical protein